MVVRELVALLGVKSDTAGMKKAEGGMAKVKLAAQAAAVAFAALAAVKWAKNITQEIAEVGDRFDKLAKRTGFLTKDLQGLEHAAELSGASLGAVESFMRRLQASQVDAAAGLKTYTREFDRLGLEIKEADGTFVDTTELTYRFADALQKLETDAERTAVIMKLGGRAGTQLLPMFKEGGGKIREMAAEMSNLHAIMDDALIQASADWIDNQRRMSVVARSAKMAIAKELLPFMNQAAESIIKWWEANGDWIKQDIGAVFKRVGSIVSSFGKVAAGVVNRVLDFWGSLTKAEKGMLALKGAIVVIGALLMAGPIGKFILLGSIIALLVEDFMVWREGGVSAIGMIIEKLNEWLGIDVVAWVKGIAHAWVTTGKAVYETIFALVDFLINVWSDPEAAWKKFVLMLEEIWGEWWMKAAGPVGDLIEWLEEQWLGVVTWFEDNIITPIANFFSGLWDGVIEGVKKITGPLEEVGQKVAALFGGGAEEGAGTQPPAAGGGGMLMIGDILAGAQGGQTATGARVGGSPSVTQNTQVDITVNAGPGMNEKAVADEVGKHFKKMRDKENRDAMGAFANKSPVPVG